MLKHLATMMAVAAPLSAQHANAGTLIGSRSRRQFRPFGSPTCGCGRECDFITRSRAIRGANR
jgi:hypothetical protein